MPTTQWSPRPAGIALCAVGGLFMAVGSVTLASDTPGRVLSGIAAAGLVVYAAGTWRARPKLALDADGLVLRGWIHARRLSRSDVAVIRLVEFSRLGRRVRMLEIETVAGSLVMLSRWDLGTAPADVFDTLVAAGYPGRKKS